MWGRTWSCGGSPSRLFIELKTTEAAYKAAAGGTPAPHRNQRIPRNHDF